MTDERNEPTEEELDELIKRKRDEMPEREADEPKQPDVAEWMRVAAERRAKVEAEMERRRSEPRPTCPTCGNEMSGSWCIACAAAREAEERVAEREAALRAELLAKSELPRRLQAMTFEGFHPATEQQAQAKRHCEDYAGLFDGRDRPERGILLAGPVGTGKTHLAASIMNVAMAANAPALFISTPTLLFRMREAFNDDEADRDWLERAKTAALLVLDDVGAHKTTEWADEQLFQIINHRWGEYLPTVVTTNLAGAALERAIDARNVSRLVQMCDWVALKGEDYRWKNMRTHD